MDDELTQLRKLAGINEFKVYKPYNVGQLEGSNISITGNEKGQLMKKLDIQPGTPEWFKLWFAMPLMTGEKPIEENC
jgi:hypothetical protein